MPTTDDNNNWLRLWGRVIEIEGVFRGDFC